jgi:Glycosyl transferase family 8
MTGRLMDATDARPPEFRRATMDTGAKQAGVYRVPAERRQVSIGDTDQVMAVAEAIAATVEALVTTRALFAEGQRRCAYVSFVTPAYRWGLIVWLRSLRKVTDKPVILFVTEPITLPADAVDVVQLVVPGLSEEQYASDRGEFKNVLAKLWIFALTPLERIFLIDVDCLVLGPLDHLFDDDDFLVCPDYVEHRDTSRFNSGVMIFNPTVALRDFVFATSPGVASYDGGDQGLLNAVLADRVTLLPERFNLLRHFHYFSATSVADDVRILHYIVKKPWELAYRESPDGMLVDLDDRWTAYLTHHELLALVQEWRRSIFVHSERARIESVRGPQLAPLMQRIESLDGRLAAHQALVKRLQIGALAGAVAVGLVLLALAPQFFYR